MPGSRAAPASAGGEVTLGDDELKKARVPVLSRKNWAAWCRVLKPLLNKSKLAWVHEGVVGRQPSAEARAHADFILERAISQDLRDAHLAALFIDLELEGDAEDEGDEGDQRNGVNAINGVPVVKAEELYAFCERECSNKSGARRELLKTELIQLVESMRAAGAPPQKMSSFLNAITTKFVQIQQAGEKMSSAALCFQVIRDHHQQVP